MHPKLILAALAALSIAGIAPAAARNHQVPAEQAGTYRTDNDGRSVFVSGAEAPRTGRRASQWGTHEPKASRMDMGGGRSKITHQRARQREIAPVDANGSPAQATSAKFAQVGSGIVVSRKTGATARVAPGYRAKFQAYVDDLEAGGAVVRFMGGYRKGPCWSGGLHPCGKALDVCQLARGRVDPKCRLPGRATMIAIAARHGLTEGGIWCNSDYGHAQVGMTAGPCGSNLYSAVSKFKRGRFAHRGDRKL